MNLVSWAAMGSTLIAAVSLFFLGWQVREQRRQARVALGNLYMERYWQIDDALLISVKGTDEHRRHRHRYLRLFEDEFEAARLRFLDARQWRVWHNILEEPRALALVEEDLLLCDPDATRFNLLRACVGQRLLAGESHGVADCDATVLTSKG